MEEEKRELKARSRELKAKNYTLKAMYEDLAARVRRLGATAPHPAAMASAQAAPASGVGRGLHRTLLRWIGNVAVDAMVDKCDMAFVLSLWLNGSNFCFPAWTIFHPCKISLCQGQTFLLPLLCGACKKSAVSRASFSTGSLL